MTRELHSSTSKKNGGGGSSDCSYSNKKRSEHLFVNRVTETYGSDCKLFYGDWSTNYSLKGCDPSPSKGLKKVLSKIIGQRI